MVRVLLFEWWVFSPDRIRQPVTLAVPPPELPERQDTSTLPSFDPVTPTPSIPSITINFSGSQSGTFQVPQIVMANPVTSTPSFSHNGLPSPASQPALSSGANTQPQLFSQSLSPSENDLKAIKWAQIAAKYGDARLRNHDWDFIDGEFLPHYNFRPLTQISEVWTEWTEGIDGCLSLRELDEGWGARWRRNVGAKKTEYGRRKKITDLVGWLVANKPRWDTRLAVQFLMDQFQPRFKSARSFSDFLTRENGSGLTEIKNTAHSYVFRH
jgi:hypothetical protein